MSNRWSVNLTPAERVARVAVGAAAALAGPVLLVLAGLDLVVTGATGHCPLYARLGHIPAQLHRRSS